MYGIWAVARQTLHQCLRTKIAAVFIILLALMLGLLPTALSGDGTQAGKIQAFLSYSISGIGVLLSIITVLMTVHVLSRDVEQKTITTVATKPLARWQYILGRWGGMMLLNGILLTIAGVVAYSQAQYMRFAGEMNAQDRQRIESEIFVARERVPPVPIEVAPKLEEEIDRLRRHKKLEGILRAYMNEKKISRQEAMAELRKDKAEKILADEQHVPPAWIKDGELVEGGTLEWTFKDVEVDGKSVRLKSSIRKAEVVAVRPRTRANEAWYFVEIEIPAGKEFLGRLYSRRPLTINNREAWVTWVDSEAGEFRAWVPLRGDETEIPRLFRPGRDVDLVAEPLLQLQYKIDPSGDYDYNQIPCKWVITNPEGTARYEIRRLDARGAKLTLAIPARMVGKQGRLQVKFTNLSQYSSMKINQSDVAVLVPVASFTGNFIRSLLLVLLRLGFMAALGVCFGSFLGFAVGVVACFAVLPFGLFRGYLTEATNMLKTQQGEVTLFGWVTRGVMWVMKALLPDLESTSGGERLVDGLLIPWMDLASAGFWVLVIRSSLLVVLACWIWHRRELARVQV
jgi:hypothetical protein